MEHKTLRCDAAELKFDSAKAGVFAGYASVFGGLDSYGDTIVKGAYADTLAGRTRPVQMRWNHFGPVIGKWTTIREDEKGLWVEGALTPGHTVAADTYALMRHGAVDGLSIGYRPVKSEQRADGVRELQQIDLVEISVVESPADLGAKISDVKAALSEIENWKEFERLLREAAPFSRADATAIVAVAKRLADGERRAEEEKSREIAEMIRGLVTLN